jgi:adenosylcobinamide-GDP ribazoletransferase
MTPGEWLRDGAVDLKVSVLFSTRLPLVHAAPIGGVEIARASWALPIAGVLVGLIGALVYWLAHRLIMRDSRVGSYGACALVISLILRISALASLAEPTLVALALIAAHAGARAMMPAFMRLVPQARDDGLAADAGRPTSMRAATAGVLGLIALGLGLSPSTALMAALVLIAATSALAWLCTRQIGGQTGDVLGALEQTGEILILLTAAA